MKLLFAHDHRFLRGENGGLFTLGSFPAEFWSRYLEHFDEVDVVARDGGSLAEGMRLSSADRIAVRFHLLPNLSSGRQLLFRSAEIDRRMKALVASSDAVVARLPSEVGLLAVRYAIELGKPYAVEVVGCAWDGYYNNGALAARLYAPLAFLRNRAAIAKAPMALYVTSSWLQDRYPSAGERISASNVALVPMDEGGRVRRAERLAQLAQGKSAILGTVASLQVKSKGIQTAFAALAQLRSVGLDLVYRILGSGDIGPWQQLAERFGISDLVHFDGTRRAGDEVGAWLDDIDIHLQPSFQEGLPRATIEAMSRGAACVGSTCGGIPELLPVERLHRPGDVTALAAIVSRLVNNPAEVAAASAHDLEEARQFDPEILRKKRSDFFGRLHKRAQQNSWRAAVC